MKFFAVLFFVCNIVVFTVAASTTSAYASSAAAAPATSPASEPQGFSVQVSPSLAPCAGGPSGLRGQKLYYFF
ncbi:uncharacterized protein LOC26525979 [Drosophila erecta]|uniref:uncharacterized protein LOC26525979 n=1 Tax=Drosophila erecta TaxID=7220 RepID=UPI000732869A|nr:uncharacterized protein LOC26525979 [Drosophila erecta]KQS38892.1 uncharacterized protein Dere_GG26155 [Drosophila erecta]